MAFGRPGLAEGAALQSGGEPSTFPFQPYTLQTVPLMGCRHSSHETSALPGIGAMIGLVRRVDRLLENVEKAQLGLEALEKRISAAERPHDRA